MIKRDYFTLQFNMLSSSRFAVFISVRIYKDYPTERKKHSITSALFVVVKNIFLYSFTVTDNI